MAKTENVQARIEPELKHNAERVLRRIGLSPSQAINVFYRQIIMRNGIPFDVAVPNEETKVAIRDARSRKGTKKFESVDDLYEDLES